MVRQIVWYGAISFLALLAFFFLIPAVSDTYKTFQLQGLTSAHIIEWRAKEEPDGYFYPYAHYSYKVEGHSYETDSFYKQGFARNPYALHPILVKLSEESLSTYYNKAEPSIASLDKSYPYKEWLKGLAALLLSAYFFVLKRKQAPA